MIGRANKNPILDTQEYIVEFEDDKEAALAANTIAQSMYAQCDPDGNQDVMFDSIVEFRRSTTVLCYTNQLVRKDGQHFIQRSTAGWQLYVQWKDGSTSWEKLSDPKELHPIECAKYAVAQTLQAKPAFNWRVSYVLKKQEHLISLVKRGMLVT